MTTHTLRLDVRPILAGGRDPFAEIMQAARGVPANGVMVVVAPFDPVPLREVLGQSGFTSAAVPRGPREWEITFTREGKPAPAPAPSTESAVAGTASPRTWSDASGHHVDVRGMAAGPALQAVLAALDAAGPGATLVAHLDHNIDALYPELAQRDCEAAFVPGDGAEVRLEIVRPGAGRSS
ncbi:MAG: DUF2249 domain-containing protein [Proteobacteria bacterium]|nr:DUF2249 domain-containing protein [Pseudomonadota bacterium]